MMSNGGPALPARLRAPTKLPTRSNFMLLTDSARRALLGAVLLLLGSCVGTDGVLPGGSTGCNCDGSPGTDGMNGANGAPGPYGVPSLTKVTPEDPNPQHCPLGGARVDVGPDTNGNGTLDANEVMH